MSLAAEFFISNNSGKHYRSWSAVFAPEVVLSFSPVPRRHAQSLREKFISLISELMFSDLNTSLRHLIEPSKQPYQGSALPRKKAGPDKQTPLTRLSDVQPDAHTPAHSELRDVRAGVSDPSCTWQGSLRSSGLQLELPTTWDLEASGVRRPSALAQRQNLAGHV